MLILIVILPLLSFFSGCILGRFLGYGVCYITISGVLVSLFISCNLFYEILSTGVSYKIQVAPWIISDSLTINWCFCFDSLTSTMLIVVTFISSLVHIYSTEYMKEDPHLYRFMSYLSLFTFFMLVLVTANNFLQLFVGWEGVGLASYLLINFWFTRIQANKSSIKAMLINRVGDFFLLLAIFAIYFICDSLDFDVVFSIVTELKDYVFTLGYLNISIIHFICLCLFLGAVGKSAQLGLHSWLPDAMEGPTPVSALIHAATMVTAGVFLIIRCSFLFEYAPEVLNIIVVLGSITALFAATTGLFQNDIKRVIAYSTCSQLGYMVFACGLSSYDVGLFHLSNHAFFKALLFLGAGSVIHAVSDEQDMRKMGGLKNILPFSYAAILIGSLALTGFPFLAGFYSKDVILELAYAKSTVYSIFAYYLGTFAAFCTSYYSTRLLILVFLVRPNGNRKAILGAHEGAWNLTLPLFLLSILSVVVGYSTKEFFIGFGTDFWGNSIFILPQNYTILDIEFISLFYKLLPLIVTILGALSAIYLYSFGIADYFQVKKSNSFKYLYYFLNRKWFFDKLINDYIASPSLYLGYTYTYKDIDRGVVEKFGPSGIVTSIKTYTKSFRFVQTGYIYNYLLLIIFYIYFIISVYLFIDAISIPLSLLFFFLAITLFYREDF